MAVVRGCNREQAAAKRPSLPGRKPGDTNLEPPPTAVDGGSPLAGKAHPPTG